jgi:hypothetical protein
MALLQSSNIMLNDDIAEIVAIEIASSHGRVQSVNAAVGEIQTIRGNVMRISLRGGHGRAGGGAEPGGLRALRFHHQISAMQAPRGRGRGTDRGRCSVAKVKYQTRRRR